jgi:manganese oxidase
VRFSTFFFILLSLIVGIPAAAAVFEPAVSIGEDVDGDGDPDEIGIVLEVVEFSPRSDVQLQWELYPGQKDLTFWVFAPQGQGMTTPARLPSPTIRVEEGDRVKITLRNTHYFPHTIHLHGVNKPNTVDGVPEFTQKPVFPGQSFTYEFTAVNPGTHFYHCHVQPNIHILMGLHGMFIIEPNRPHNTVHQNVLTYESRIQPLSQAVQEAGYDREYVLVYSDVDPDLHQIPHEFHAKPAAIAQAMHQQYNTTQRRPRYFLLNGRCFPYTLRESQVIVREGEKVKLRVLNAGSKLLALHLHGHHPTLTHLDGYAVPAAARVTRDVFSLAPAQRVDLELNTQADGYHASGPGVWLLHDHHAPGVTNNGISPGGNLNTITYEGYLDQETGLPKVAGDLSKFFHPDYYQAKVPVFDLSIFHVEQGAETQEK